MSLLQLAKTIGAIHISVIVGLTLYIERAMLPKKLKPSVFSYLLVLLAMLFFIRFAGLYPCQFLSGQGHSS